MIFAAWLSSVRDSWRIKNLRALRRIWPIAIQISGGELRPAMPDQRVEPSSQRSDAPRDNAFHPQKESKSVLPCQWELLQTASAVAGIGLSRRSLAKADDPVESASTLQRFNA